MTNHHSMFRSFRVVAAILVVLAGLQATAQAQDNRLRTAADERRRKGNELYAQGRFEEALQLYQAAYDLFPEPRHLFNIGLAREKTFDYEGCAVTFRRFLRDTADLTPEVRKQAEERLASCRERAQISVRFTSAPTNAAIYVGQGEAKTLRGRTPQDLTMPPGTHVISMEMSGYLPRTDTIQVEPGEKAQVDFVLEKLSILRIEADPSGAKVKIDDHEWEASPAVREVKAGMHRVELTKEGYQPTVREVRVEPGQKVSVVLSLQPLPRIRKLDIRTKRPVANLVVRVDGQAKGTIPMAVEISPGPHRIEAMAPSHLPFAGDITVPEDRDLKLVARMTPVRSRANKIVFFSLAGASVAAAIAGSVYGGLTLADEKDFRDNPTPDLSDRGDQKALITDVCFGSSVLLAGSSALWWWLTSPHQSTLRVTYE